MANKKNKITSPLKAIREKCLDCSCGSPKEVKLCATTECSLFPFRYGTNPFCTHNITEERRQELAVLMKLNRTKNLDPHENTEKK